MSSIPDMHGAHNVRVVANPGAGNEFQLGPITATRMRIIGLRFSFSTDATVVDRRVNIGIRDAVTVCTELVNAQTQAASLTYDYSLWPGFSGDSVRYVTWVMMPWSMLFVMDQVFYIASLTAGIQGGDVFTNIAYATEEWISEP